LASPILREGQVRTIEYLRRANVKFSDGFERIMRHSFEYADPLCAGLVLWATQACGGDSHAAVPLAASVECLHRFATLHDELQMMPSYSIERETTSSIWGLAQTLNAGDAFHALGMGLLAQGSLHRDRVLDAGIVLEKAVLRSVEERNRLVNGAMRVRGGSRLRVAYNGTQATMLGVSLHVGAIMADAPMPLTRTLLRAGRLLGVVVQLQSQAYGRSSALAKRYAAKASMLVEATTLAPRYAAEFKEIAHELAGS